MHFRNRVRAPVVGALLALSAISPVAAQNTFSSEGTYEIPAGAKFNPEKLAKITAFFKNEVDTGKISGADVLIRQRGKDVYHETFGVQDVASKTPITDKTIFRLSSLTKAITSVVAMQLIQDGKMKLDDPVSKYLPDLTRAKDVKVRQLLSHTSGYRDYWPQDFAFIDMETPTTPQHILDKWAKAPLDFDP